VFVGLQQFVEDLLKTPHAVTWRAQEGLASEFGFIIPDYQGISICCENACGLTADGWVMNGLKWWKMKDFSDFCDFLWGNFPAGKRKAARPARYRVPSPPETLEDVSGGARGGTAGNKYMAVNTALAVTCGCKAGAARAVALNEGLAGTGGTTVHLQTIGYRGLTATPVTLVGNTL